MSASAQGWALSYRSTALPPAGPARAQGAPRGCGQLKPRPPLPCCPAGRALALGLAPGSKQEEEGSGGKQLPAPCSALTSQPWPSVQGPLGEFLLLKGRRGDWVLGTIASLATQCNVQKRHRLESKARVWATQSRGTVGSSPWHHASPGGPLHEHITLPTSSRRRGPLPADSPITQPSCRVSLQVLPVGLKTQGGLGPIS